MRVRGGDKADQRARNQTRDSDTRNQRLFAEREYCEKAYSEGNHSRASAHRWASVVRFIEPSNLAFHAQICGLRLRTQPAAPPSYASNSN